MRLAYADPPYPGCAHLYVDHPDYDGEVDHEKLIEYLWGFQGWALSTSAAALQHLLPLCPPDIRVLAWVKCTVNVSWEPVIVKSGRPISPRGGPRDWIQVEPEAFQYRPKPDSYVIGQKPPAFCDWLFHWLGAEPGDELEDMFPGSGAVTRAWERWKSQPPLFSLPNDRQQRRDRKRMLDAHPVLPQDVLSATEGMGSSGC